MLGAFPPPWLVTTGHARAGHVLTPANISMRCVRHCACVQNTWLASIKCVSCVQAARLSVIGLLAHLELTLGRCVAASALESMGIAVKWVSKWCRRLGLTLHIRKGSLHLQEETSDIRCQHILCQAAPELYQRLISTPSAATASSKCVANLCCHLLCVVAACYAATWPVVLTAGP